MQAFVGTSGYQYDEWKGTFYPAKLSKAKMLSFYAERFSTVEINYTFRTMPTVEVLARWRAQVPAEFRFSLKAPQTITHHKRLLDCAAPVKEFAAAALTLKKQLAPTLLQLPPNFKIDLPRLKTFLRGWPKKLPAAIEFRHDSWFVDETWALLQKAGVALCIADTDDLATPEVMTAPFGYFRLRRLDYDKKAIARWAARIGELCSDDAFVYFKHEESGSGPRFAAELLARLGR